MLCHVEYIGPGLQDYSSVMIDYFLGYCVCSSLNPNLMLVTLPASQSIHQAKRWMLNAGMKKLEGLDLLHPVFSVHF